MRKALPTRLRFEVFKRDKFTCQYCGGRAPEIVLHVDHINPVAHGGTNDILNLVTSCAACNLGKSDRLLSDDSTVAKQRDQMDELQDRREQLDMLMAWKNGLLDLDAESVIHAVTYFEKMAPGLCINDKGKSDVKKWLKKDDLSAVLDAMQSAVSSYAEFENGEMTLESFQVVWSYIPRIIKVKRAEKEKPYIKDLLYIRGILKNRLNITSPQVRGEVYKKMEQALLVTPLPGNGVVTVESLTDAAKKARTLAEWQAWIDAWITKNQPVASRA